jgi:hypothetical protein
MYRIFKRFSVIKLYAFWLLVFLCSGSIATAQSSTFPGQIKLTKIDGRVTHYATFQSNNQKVVANSAGIFTTHIRDRDEAYQAQTWRLSRSTDGGATFETIYQQTAATNPPVLETDSDANLFLAAVDFKSGDGLLYRFDHDKKFANPTITTIPAAAAGKYAMLLDEPRQQLFFFSHNNSFHQITTDGIVQKSVELMSPGVNAILQYPLLAMGDDDALHAGWTTVKHGEYLYWDIHHMSSPDRGDHWVNFSGQTIQIPVVADDGGPTNRISADDDFDFHSWLSSMAVRDGKIHFAYMVQSQPPRQNYVRYDLASGRRDVHLQPEFKGEQISLLGLSGFFVTDPDDAALIYYVSNDAGRIAALRSIDHGQTWHDFARTDQAYSPYAIGGFRQTHNGNIVGTFTDSHATADVLDFQSDVYSFVISPTE